MRSNGVETESKEELQETNLNIESSPKAKVNMELSEKINLNEQKNESIK